MTDGPASRWDALIADGERLAREARFGPFKLPCDWIDVLDGGTVVPAAGKPPRFGFDALRPPLYQLLGGRRPLTSDAAIYWRDLVDRGGRVPASIDVVTGERAEYALSDGGMAIVRRSLGVAAPAAKQSRATDYYSDVLSLLAQL